ncbi:MAG: GTP 3',8-cyclase MoaA [Deltaproteobacteria bacterium HGW-Deltaproteobacteria-21]|nr:MAG: GTP 3',8-cyclase MoaA [Deltaproteobacteria bacterium HGW-Deltaproteobacteria-21]
MKEMAPDKREINYLRISITDRCNLRCIYCMNEEGIQFLAHDEVLSYEEILHLVRVSVQGGIRKVRLTGGEPLIRKGFIPFLEKLSGIHELDEITLTTNGVLLEEYAEAIRNCGICRLNISLDSLKAERFHGITRRDCFDRTLAGIHAAERAGFDPIKINVVAMRGINDDELVDFARLTMEKPYHIRFIEFMPMGDSNGWDQKRFIPTEEIHQRIKALGPLNPLPNHRLDGPASRYKIEGATGEIGFIGPLSHHFCDRCNRLRLTADGQLRGCLFSDSEIDVKTPMREGRPDSFLLELIRQAIRSKPLDHGPLEAKPKKCVRPMSAIGG